jgi:hypothetical protein
MDQQLAVRAFPAVSRPSPAAWCGGVNRRTMMRKFAVIALATAAAIGAAASAQAGTLGRACTTAPETEWLSLDALKGKVEALGYKVQKGKIKNACGELYALDKNGAKVELFVDPTNGAIVGQL